jgi:UTP-glucose-1-phosphate uridylyltransferase
MRVKALIPAAGRGARMRALTGGRPKELLTVGPLTLIEHALAGAAESGLSDIGLVIGPGKEGVRAAAERFLAEHHPEARLTVFHQPQPDGVARAMLLAADWSAGHALAVVMPDHLTLGPPGLAVMIDAFGQCRTDVIGAVPVPVDHAARFGNVGRMTLDETEPGPPRVVSFSPKGPGGLTVPGGGRHYKGHLAVIFAPGWAEDARNLSPAPNGEYDDTDLVIQRTAERRLRAALLPGRAFDVGRPQGLDAARRAWEAHHP